MPRMYPSELSNTIRRDFRIQGEVKMYDALARSLGNDWSVFHSVAWQDKPSETAGSRDGETDFIVAHPDLGVLVLEVKGGQIAFDGGRQQWTSTSGAGKTYDIDPYGQVRRNKYSLIDYVQMRRHQRGGAAKLPIYDAVAFPDCERPRVSIPEAPPEMTIDGLAFTNLEKTIRSVFAFKRGRQPSEGAFGHALIEDLTSYLAPTLQLKNPLALTIGEEREDYIRLTEGQFALLHALRRKRRLAVSGCAGSGKTMMAVEKARQLAEAGFRTLLTCFSRDLSDYLAERTAGIDGLVVGNIHRVARQFAGEADVPWTDGEWDSQPGWLMDATSKRPDLCFDAVLVDEGQDFSETWWIAIQCLLADQQNGILYTFFDDNQRLYDTSTAIPSELELWPLDENVRNTRAIFRYVERNYLGDEPITPRGPSGRTVEVHTYETDVEMKRLLGSVVRRLTAVEHVLASDIVILTPNSLSDGKKSALTEVKTLGSTTVEVKKRTNDKSLLVSTIQSFKGREQSVVIVCELDERFAERENAVELAYVACSRPLHHLVLVGRPAVIDRLGSSSLAAGEADD